MGADQRGDDYAHPKSGRIYRQGDPAHSFALALNGARLAAEMFLHETAAIADGDYLLAHENFNQQASYRLRDALDALFHAEHGVRIDRYRREAPDDEWRRRYGQISS